MYKVSGFRTGKLIDGSLYVKTRRGNWIALKGMVEMIKKEGCH
jgi:hypothetical protein